MAKTNGSEDFSFNVSAEFQFTRTEIVQVSLSL